MFVLYDIEKIDDDLDNLPENAAHRMTFRAVYTIKEVPDSFTGIVYQMPAEPELALGHFNNPRGNVRKIITLKNKLPEGVFAGLKDLLFAICQGDKPSFPLQGEELKQRLNQ